MPRETFDIKEFKYGVISSVDAEDIPSESASDSLNVDGDVGEGRLRGIPTDTEFTVSAASIGNMKNGEMLQFGDEYHFVYHDSSANTISAILDFYNSYSFKKKVDLITGLTSNKQVVFTKNKKQLHIGIEDSTAKWVGYGDHGIFSLGTSWTITGCANSGTGTIRVSVSAEHAMKNGNIVRISGVTGTTEANGYWKIENSYSYDDGVTDPYFDLVGSTFSNLYVNGGTALQSIFIEDSACSVLEIEDAADKYHISSITEAATSAGYFQSGTYHEWRISVVFDGIEESGLYAYPAANSYSDTASAEIPYYELQLRALGAEPSATNTYLAFNRRVTGINIYRADSDDGVAANIGLFRKVVFIDINSTDGYWQTSTSNKLAYIRDYGTYAVISKSGATAFTTSKTEITDAVTYKENTGISETIYNNNLNWSLAASGNGYHFVGHPVKSEISPDVKTYIFRSKNYRYDMFDWTSDFLVMPEKPVAMHFYDGKLWAFSLNKTYRINPDGLYIEDVFEDAGCQGYRSVHSNEYGMFFGNSLNAWMYRGGNFYPIGDAIRQTTTSGKSWQTFYFTTLADLIITSDAKKRYVLFINERNSSGAKIFAWAYSTVNKRWDAWSFADYASSANAGAFKGKDGEVYLSYATATQKLMRHATDKQLWEWYSQDLSFGKTRQDKSMTMVKIDAGGTVSLTYGLNGGAVSTAYTNESLINSYAKSIRVKLNAASGDNYVDSMEIVYRPKIGAR